MPRATLNEHDIVPGTYPPKAQLKPAKSHGISVSLQKSAVTSRSHGNVKKTHGIRVI